MGARQKSFFLCVHVFFIIQNNQKLQDNDYNHNNYKKNQLQKYNKAASYNIKLTCTRQTSIQK